ncbi:MAG: YraN family protein [Acidobacteria bacterium]|nr:MAG: YraN family protein [Acidobacteriota bacterium]
MGMGHVPSGPIPRARPSAHLSGRQRGRARKGGALDLDDPRRELGEFGEKLAVWFLTDHGLDVVGANIQIADGELDLIAIDGNTQVVVEVRTTRHLADPIDAIGEAKRRRVKGLVGGSGAHRVDFIGIRIDGTGFDVHWLPGPN